MNKFLLIVFLGTSLLSVAQESDKKSFNHWSIDLGIGLHKPEALPDRYSTNTPDFFQGNIGARYMINEKFGFRVDFGYSKFTEGDDSLPFSTKYFRGNVEGVINAGEVLGFRNWTNRINFLVHGGVGLSHIYANNIGRDRTVSFIAGITPQVKITDRVALFADVSAIGHFYQDISISGQDLGISNRREINGGILNASIGLNIYLGKNKVHADWYSNTESLTSELDEIRNRLKNAETEIAALKNKAPIKSDFNKAQLLNELDSRYAEKGAVTTTVAGKDYIRELLDKGYQNVYFKFGNTKIQDYSLVAVNYLRQYMTENPSVKAELIGYADEIGSSDANVRLSERRAKKVYEILVNAGIDANRLSYNGKGEDTSVNSSSSEARQIVRRVTFRIK